MRQLYHFATGNNCIRVAAAVDILKTVEVLSGQLTIITKTSELLSKSCAKSEWLFLNI